MLDFARTLTLPSALCYGLWRFAKRQEESVSLALRSGIRIELRPDGCGNGDYGVAYEVFVLDFYRPPAGIDPAAVRLVVDLGANVGFSVLHWLAAFPTCRVIAFEPHPAHVAQARRNLALNGAEGRVELHMVAAGARTRRMALSDEGTSSSLGTAGGTEVEVVDVFPLLLGCRIDLLKIDIEGGEYEIFEDPRFAKLDIGAIVMEWHARGQGEEDRAWCERRLQALGFNIETLFATPTHGMFWALRGGPHPAMER